MRKTTFWQYLLDNAFRQLGLVTLVILGFMTYWVVSSGWENSATDIVIGFCILGFVWLVYLIGNYITWRKL